MIDRLVEPQCMNLLDFLRGAAEAGSNQQMPRFGVIPFVRSKRLEPAHRCGPQRVDIASSVGDRCYGCGNDLVGGYFFFRLLFDELQQPFFLFRVGFDCGNLLRDPSSLAALLNKLLSRISSNGRPLLDLHRSDCLKDIMLPPEGIGILRLGFGFFLFLLLQRQFNGTDRRSVCFGLQ